MKLKYPFFFSFLYMNALLSTYIVQAQPFPSGTNKTLKTNLNPTDSCKKDSFLVKIFHQNPEFFAFLEKNDNPFKVQLTFTEVTRGANGIPTLKSFYYKNSVVNPIFPGIAYKLPLCLLALQKMNELRLSGIYKYTTMLTGIGYEGQKPAYNDPFGSDGRPSLALYIKKLLIAGDPAAYDRIYEFLGAQYIYDQMKKKGYQTLDPGYRMNGKHLVDENNHTNPIKFIGNMNNTLYEQGPATFYPLAVSKDNIQNQRGVTEDEMHRLLISLIFPSMVHAEERFEITPADRKFLLKYMGQFPTESFAPPYQEDSTHYPKNMCKFLFPGTRKKIKTSNWREFNSAGNAEGQLTDIAYFVDFENKLEFFITANIIYCPEFKSMNTCNDQVLGLPFMQHLGEVLYEYELKRPGRAIPDLSEIQSIND